MKTYISSVVASEWRDSVLLVAPSALGDDGATAPSDPLQPLGLIATPRDPEKDADGAIKSACPALALEHGDDTKILPLTDPATVGAIPQGKGGSTLLTATSGKTSYHFIDGETGYHQILTKYDRNGTEKSLSLNLDCKSDDPKITLTHGEGNTIRLHQDGSVYLASSDGTAYVHVQKNGKVIINGDLQVNGSVLGGGESGSALALAKEVQQLRDILNVILTAGLSVNIATLLATLPPGVLTLTPLVTPLSGSTKASAAD